MKKIIKNILQKYGYTVEQYPIVPMNIRQMNSLLYFGSMYDRINNVEGSVVECGIGKGRSFLYLSFLIDKEGKKRKIWGFDSFEGFPEPDKEDSSVRNPKKGEWSDTSISYIKKILKNAGIKKEFILNNTMLVKGFFNKSLKEYSDGKIALLHIDVDLYQSYMDVLNKLFPLVAKGGVVLFDEYGEDNWPGAKKAVDEFFAQTSHEILKEEKSGKYYVVKK